MSELPKLGVFGTLNYEKLKEMSDDQRREFVQENVKNVLNRRTTSDGKGPVIAYDDTTIYEVTCDYKAIDVHYNEQGHLLAVLTCQRKDGEIAVETNSVTYQQQES